MRKSRLVDLFSAAFVIASVFVLMLAINRNSNVGDSMDAAGRVERRVERRMALLDKYIANETVSLPPDMVVYHYEGDSLKNWRGQFSVNNDDIEEKMLIEYITSPRNSFRSPLTSITDSLGFYNLGSKWYLAKSIQHDDGLVIAGLEILNTSPGLANNGVNRHIRVPSGFSIQPLDRSGGTEVVVDGRPQFKVVYDQITHQLLADARMIWLAFSLLLAGLFLYLWNKRTARRFMIVTGVSLATILAMYFWGRSGHVDAAVFSPVLYAGGSLLYSLGAVVLVNLQILITVGALFLVREDIYRHITTRKGTVAGIAVCILSILLILAYTHLTLCSIIINSSISLELYKLSELSVWTAVVYASFMAMLLSVPMLLQMMQPALSRLVGRHFDAFSTTNRVIFASLLAIYLVLLPAFLGFRKEHDRAEIWSNQLAIDRDITLEMQLLRAEVPIAEDAFIAPLSMFEAAELTIRNRIADNYLSRVSQLYDINVYLLNSQSTPEKLAYVNSLVVDGEPIADGSNFYFVDTGAGHTRYEGMFIYFVEGSGMARLLVEVEQNSIRRNQGYATILELTPPGRVHIPQGYAYARYEGADLKAFNGNYAYPTKVDATLENQVYEGGLETVKEDDFVHFIHKVGNSEAVVISRPTNRVASYVIAAVFIALISFLLMFVFNIGHRRRRVFSNNYYKTRITWVLMTSLILTLVAMALVSVLFVYRRNESNLNTIMSEKVNSIQAMVQSGVRGARSTDDLRSPEMKTILEQISISANADVSIYSPSGKLMMTTAPEVFARNYLACRMNEVAFDQIIHHNKRYFVHRENIDRHKFYCMYAPVFGENSEMLAIIGSPYTGGETYEFERDAVMHSITILTVFLILLILARFVAVTILDRMFKPMNEISGQMRRTDLDSLEEIQYDRDDEISYLVDAYNRMVTELSESTRKLAKAEREEAWSEMARQVAHEIKNPLTPMKLQIQRVIRLKQRGDDSWQDKFDEASKVLLDHIDILTDTANEFSTFAKLYTEEHVSLDLDTMLQEEISMFDNRDDISFEYMGLKGTHVMGPKPQLTRVFVNLIGNAVQAVEDVDGGRVLVSLRKSVEDGFYDIVVEDNGSGVAPENVDRLFTPNFTTKSGGTGLGLAISRSVLERCGATISYSKSFALGGACFTIKYPAC